MWIDELRTLRKERLIGWEILFLPEVDSTNRKGHDLARQGAREGTVVMADSQSRGRGRLGRSWESPAGLNVYSSFILRPPIAASTAPQVTLLAGVAAARALAGASGLDIRIKWPNDIFVNGRKLAGILAEMEAEGPRTKFIILGVGVNVNWRKEDLSPDLRASATSLLVESGREISRVAVAERLFQELEEEYLRFLREGFSPRLREEWDRFSWINEKKVTVMGPDGEISGRALGLDGDGALLLMDEEGQTRRFIAGDVSLRRTDNDE
jgi:BirA family transcriptional regulator, biotin operon repressor / biotin---[acetyl-CoA-carboxylase] ligase